MGMLKGVECGIIRGAERPPRKSLLVGVEDVFEGECGNNGEDEKV